MIRDPRRAALVAIGDELLAGEVLDTNSGHVARALFEQGIEVDRVLQLPDQRASLAKAFYDLCSEYRLVVACGGLGPTLDDVTREAAADAAGVELQTHSDVLEDLRARWRERGREMPVSNERQAQFPAGAQIMPNRVGTAPGFRVWLCGGVLAVLPGPPHELSDMLERELVPWLQSTTGRGGGLAIGHLFLAGVAESQFADQVGARMNRNANPRIGVTAQPGLLRVSVRAECATLRAAQELTERTLAELRRQFGDSAFEHTPDGLAGHVVGLLRANRSSLATAESITGGWIAKLLTDVPGASAVFREGFVTYSAAAKSARLGVPPAWIEREGAVSAACAAAMAEGALRASEADFGLSATGVAGPELDERGTAVGTVWLGLATPRGVETRQLVSMAADRSARRLHAAHAALDFLRRALPRAP